MAAPHVAYGIIAVYCTKAPKAELLTILYFLREKAIA